MPDAVTAAAALAVLALHVLVVAFNIFGLIAVPLGAWRRWRFVRLRWWRLAHLVSMAAVALQALAGRACFLTIWQAALEGETDAAPVPMIQGWLEAALYWDLPLWIFAVAYALLFAYTLALWALVPPVSASAG
jgi:hypothetical protein